MSYQPLHHKYRPQTFADLVGQEAIAATLTNAIQQQRIAPAYLFTGARGTGKTSSARILAKSLNCLMADQPTATPCGKCDVCRAIANSSALDVIEIDAASNTGVDNIRELIERAQFAPVQCRYKVYVVDECHMLSTAAFNALLKTLEEPPDRVIFVLATTDPQRVLPTIISRCQRFDFRRIPLESMVKHLRTIATTEAIVITDDGITLVAQISQGGLRDAESLLDQLSLLSGEVTVEKVWDLVGSVPEQDLMGLLSAIAADKPEALLDNTRRLMDRGREPLIVLQNLASFYRDLLIAKTAPQRGDLVALTPATWSNLCEFAQSLSITTILEGQKQLRSAEAQLKSTTQPRLWLEITLMGLLPAAIQAHQAVQGSPVIQPAPAIAHRTTSIPEPRNAAPPANIVTPAPPLTLPVSQPTPTIPQPLATAAPPSREPVPAPIGAPVTPGITPTVAPLKQEEPVPLSPTAAIPDLGQVWQQIIAHLHPLSKALLNEHGQLLAFSGQDVRIGISSEKLVKIAQNQVKNIEKAFLEVLNCKVKVSLEVAGPPVVKAPPPQSQPPTRIGNDASPPLPHAPSVPETGGMATGFQPPPQRNFTASEPQTAGITPRSHPPQPPQKSPPPPDAIAPPRALAESSPPSALNIPSNSWEEDIATRAAKQLAEFFGGKVVDLDDGDALSERVPGDSGDASNVFDKNIAPWNLSDDDRSSGDDDVPF